MPCYGLLLQPSFGFAPAHGIDADRMEQSADVLRFWQSGELVYSIPARYVAKIETFDSRPEAIEWLRAQTRFSGRSGVQGSEVLAARGPSRSAIIEQVSLVLEERGKTRP